MATKIDRSRLPRPPAPAAEVDELDVLHPERHVTLAGRALVVREYGHLEWLRLLPRAAPLVEAISGALAADLEPDYELVLQTLAAHGEALLPLVAQAADVEADWLAALAPDDGELLTMLWWGANGRFFVRRALNQVAVQRHRQAALQAATSAMANSSPPSLPTTTPAPTSSATPSAS